MSNRNFRYGLTAFIVFFSLSLNNLFAIMEKQSIEELTSSSEKIIIGTVQEIHSNFITGGQQGIMTYVTIRIDQNLKGTQGGTIVIIRYPGGVVGDLGMWVEDTPSFIVGEHCIIFVEKDYQDQFTVTAWRQGKFTLLDGKLRIDGNIITIDNFITGVNSFIQSGEKGKVNFEFEIPEKYGNGLVGGESVPSISSIDPNSGTAMRSTQITPLILVIEEQLSISMGTVLDQRREPAR